MTEEVRTAMQPDGRADARALDSSDSALLDTLLLEAPVAFAFYDTDLRYRRINQALAGTNGLPIDAHIGRRPSELLPDPLGRAIEDVLREVLATGRVVQQDDFTGVAPHSGEVRHWQSQWFPAHDSAGSVTGVAVVVVDVTERVRTEEALRRSQERTRRLQQATAELAGALTVGEVTSVVARIGRDAVSAAGTAVALLDGALLRFVSPGAGDEPAVSLPQLGLDLPTPTTEALRTRQPLYVSGGNDLARLLPYPRPPEPFASPDEQAWAVIPLFSSGTPLGVLRFSFRTERALDHDERVFLEALAGQCALALERARLYEREHRTAQALQRSLLPDRLPRVTNVELAARYVPALDEAQVGGDWYDAFVLPDRLLAVAVGDVMGKGVTAAAGMGRVRAALRALAFSDPAPIDVLSGLDRLFTATEDIEHLVTLLYAVIDPATGQVVAGSAGHPPLLHTPAGGGSRLLDVGERSTPLGVPEPRAQTTFKLAPGDTLMGFSDGLVETRRRGIGEGLSKLVQVVDALARDRMELLVDDVLTELAAEERPSDDVTLLAVRWSPDPLRR